MDVKPTSRIHQKMQTWVILIKIIIVNDAGSRLHVNSTKKNQIFTTDPIYPSNCHLQIRKGKVRLLLDQGNGVQVDQHDDDLHDGDDDECRADDDLLRLSESWAT